MLYSVNNVLRSLNTIYYSIGGVIRLVDYSGSLLYVGGMPYLTHHKHKTGKTLGEWSGNRHITHVSQDFEGAFARRFLQ